MNRVTAKITLGSLDLSTEDADRLTFTQLCVAGGPGTYSLGQSCELIIDGTSYFLGAITSAHPSSMGGGPIHVTYNAVGLRWLVNNIWIAASDGSGAMSWNLPQTNPDYLSTSAGKTLGQILTQIFIQHASQLSTAGMFGSPPYSTAELAALTVVPNEAIVVSGRLMNAVADLVSQWAPKFSCYVSAVDGKFHIENTLTLSATTLTLDSDPITLDSISKNHQECYTRVIVRGAADIQGAYLSLVHKTIEAGWTAAQQSAWTLTDFLRPKGASDSGVINSMTSTTLTVASDDATATWVTNFWNGIGATVFAINPVAAGITFQEQATITACTSLSAGGTSVLTLDHALANSGYTKYIIRGTRTALSLVWRKFTVVPTWIAQHLARRFQHSVPWSPADGVTTQTFSPMANVCWSASGAAPFNEFPLGFELVIYDGSACTSQATVTATFSAGAVTGFTGLSGGTGYTPSSSTIPVSIFGGGGLGATAHATSNGSGVITSVTLDTGGSGYTSAPNVTIGVINGYIMFYQPVPSVYASTATMTAGGSSVPAPGDVKVLVPYARGALTATKPTSSYEGTAYTVDGIQRTMYVDVPAWLDSGDLTNMLILAQEKLDAVKDTVIEGSLTYYGKSLGWLTLGKALNIAIAGGGTTGWESLAAPVKGVSIEYQNKSIQWVMKLRFSTRRKPFSGDRLYRPIPYAAGAGYGHGGGRNQTNAINAAADLTDQSMSRMGGDGGISGGNGDGASGMPTFAGDDFSGRDPARPSKAAMKSEGDILGSITNEGDGSSGEGETLGAATNQSDGSEAALAAQSARRERAASRGSLRESRGLDGGES